MSHLHRVSEVGSTVPGDGDVNPYGVSVVPTSVGHLVAGDVLVSNFNDKANVQGTGTSIVEISPTGKTSVFAHVTSLPRGQSCPGGIGLSTALAILRGGWVVVGSLPTGAKGALPAVDPVGCLIVLDSSGTPVETVSNTNINGPWDLGMTATPTGADLFVANVLSGSTSPSGAPAATGSCTVVRIAVTFPAGKPPVLGTASVVAAGLPWKLNPATVVLGPTGVAIDSHGTAYVAETLTNSIIAIPDALTRTTPVTAASNTITTGGSLNQPLGLTLAPNGDLIAVNGNDGNAIEITPQGTQIATVTLAHNGAGDLFGITASADGQGLLFVDDGTNTLDLFSSPAASPPASSRPAASPPASSRPASSPAASSRPASSAPVAAGPTCVIPQNNGGDHDADNNGGPNDGDGCDK